MWAGRSYKTGHVSRWRICGGGTLSGRENSRRSDWWGELGRQRADWGQWCCKCCAMRDMSGGVSREAQTLRSERRRGGSEWALERRRAGKYGERGGQLAGGIMLSSMRLQGDV